MPKPTQPPPTQEVDLFSALWQGLGSPKFAAVVLLVFTVASLVGTFIPQGESPDQYIAAYGVAKARLLDALRLTDLYYSAWYLTLLGLIVLSTVACTISRLKLTLRRGDVGEPGFTADRVRSMRASREVRTDADAGPVGSRVEEALRRSRYRTRRSESEGRTCIVADRGRVGNWGMFILHASLLVIAAGAAIGATLGFAHYEMWTTEGRSSSTAVRRDYSRLVLAPDPHSPGRQTLQPRTVEKMLPFAIHLDRFRVGVNRRGAATAYESFVRVIEGGKAVKDFRIATNRPLSYRGVRFYQNDFSLAAVVVRVTDPRGDETLTAWPVEPAMGPGGERLYRVTPSQPIQIDQAGGSVFVIPGDLLAPNYDPKVSWGLPTLGDLPANPAVLLLAHARSGAAMRMPRTIGWVTRDRSQVYGGYTFTLAGVTMESLLGVGRNPGLPIVYLGFATLVLGMVLAFYVSHRIVRVCVWEEGGRAIVAVGGTVRFGEPVFEREFAAIEKAAAG